MVTLAMAHEKDIALVRFLLEKTGEGEVKWEPTARNDQFTTSFKGKYSATVEYSHDSDNNYYYSFRLTDADDRELLQLYISDDMSVRTLFHMARRRSLNVDAAIDEIMGGPPAPAEITDEDIPF